MKIKIEMDEQAEEEVIIRCRGMTESDCSHSESSQ